MKHTWTAVPTGLAFLAGSQFVSASAMTDAEAFEIGARFMEATDDYFHHTANTGFQKKSGSVTYGVKAKHHRLRDEGRKYKGNEVKVHVGKKIGESVHVEAGIGQSRFEETNGYAENNLTTYHVEGRAKVADKVEVKLRHERDIAHKHQTLVNSYGDILSEDTTTAGIKVQATDRIRLEAEASRGKLSDGNKSRRDRVGAYYAIKPGWPYVEVGVHANRVDYDKQDPAYWTPQNYRAVGVSGSASFPVSKSVDLTASASISRSKDDHSTDYGTDTYFAVGADYKVAKNSKISAHLERIDSHQDNSDWNQTALMVGFTHNF